MPCVKRVDKNLPSQVSCFFGGGGEREEGNIDRLAAFLDNPEFLRSDYTDRLLWTSVLATAFTAVRIRPQPDAHTHTQNNTLNKTFTVSQVSSHFY